MKKLITISDWVEDSLTCQEFRSAIEGHTQIDYFPNITFVSSSPSTIHTAFLLSQVVCTEEIYGRPQQTVIFVNTDLREESIKETTPYIIKLKSGIFIIGPNSQYSFSLIFKKIDVVFKYNLVVNSQFRSRDLYSKICAFFLNEKEDNLELEEVHLNTIKTLPSDKFFIGHIDNFGNIKTTIAYDKIKGRYEYGDYLEIMINKIKRKAKFVSGLFSGFPGELILYPGSSGEKNNPFLEISAWMTPENKKTGIDFFPSIKPGMEVAILKK